MYIHVIVMFKFVLPRNYDIDIAVAAVEIAVNSLPFLLTVVDSVAIAIIESLGFLKPACEHMYSIHSPIQQCTGNTYVLPGVDAVFWSPESGVRLTPNVEYQGSFPLENLVNLSSLAGSACYIWSSRETRAGEGCRVRFRVSPHVPHVSYKCSNAAHPKRRPAHVAVCNMYTRMFSHHTGNFGCCSIVYQYMCIRI